MSNTLKIFLISALTFLNAITATAQHDDVCIIKVLSHADEDVFRKNSDYNTHTSKYAEAFRLMQVLEVRRDSLLAFIGASTFTNDEQTTIRDLAQSSTNDVSGDVYLKVKVLDPALVVRTNKYVPIALLYELDKQYYELILTTREFGNWAEKICKFIHNDSIGYVDADKVRVDDMVFSSEIAGYKFKPKEVVADLGAGSGYFERALSKYADNLEVLACDIDVNQISPLTTYLQFLERYDKTAIHYATVLGTERSSNLPSHSVDKVIIRNSFHHFSHPDDMLQDCRRILKRGGRLFIVDILVDEVDRLPQCGLHLSRSVFTNYLKRNGFVLINEVNLHYDNFKCFEFKVMLK